MATAPTLLNLQLDETYDVVFDPGAALVDANAVAQAILTRLRLFLGEWWENRDLGLPVFQQILGQLGSGQGLAAMTLTVQTNVAGAPYVTAVNAVQVKFVNGVLSITASAQTQFGPITISLSQALGG